MMPACTFSLVWGSAALLVIAAGEQGSCGPPTRLYFAELMDEYKDKTSFPVGSTVKYKCRPGYYGFKRPLTCLESLEWSEAPKFCKEKACGNPGEPDNGQLIVPKDLLFGSIVNFTCYDGHRLIGSSSMRCIITGQKVAWSGGIPVCQRIPCYPPPDIPHGNYRGKYSQDYSYGDAVTYTCDKGYPLIGEKSIHCTTKDGKNGVWSSRVSCGVTPCPAPQVENGGIVAGDSDTYNHEHNVTLGCNAGHVLTGSRKIYCQADGTWDPSVPLCKQVQCSTPQRIANGKYNSQTSEVFTKGTFVEYRCEPAYKLNGETRIYCTESGTWSSPAPYCEGSCGPPMSLKFAELSDEYKSKTSFPVGSTVKYICRPGYAGFRTSVKCLSNLTWPHINEFCRRKSCSNPGDPDNGMLIVPEDLLLGSTVNFTCADGHKLIGQSSIRCMLSGPNVIWSGKIPVCQRIQCYPPPDIPHGKQEGRYNQDYSYGDAVSYTCDKGYSPAGDKFIHCTSKDGENGVWSGRLSCGVTPCPTPQVENGGIVAGESDTYIHKHNVTLGCNAGHVLTGSREICCQADGTWDPPVPLCERVSHCPIPPDIDNGHHNATTGDIFTSHMSVTYFCDPGYSLIGKASISCTFSGDWSLPWPHCEVLQCNPPPSISNGAHDGYRLANFPVGTYVNYTCNPGYLLFGDASSHCTTSGAWSQPTPQCEVMRCPLPPRIAYGSYFGAKFTYQMSVIYVCDAGYSLVGNPMVTCTLQGSNSANWSEPPQCKGSFHSCCPSISSMSTYLYIVQQPYSHPVMY